MTGGEKAACWCNRCMLESNRGEGEGQCRTRFRKMEREHTAYILQYASFVEHVIYKGNRLVAYAICG